jgi:hypothetical protein
LSGSTRADDGDRDEARGDRRAVVVQDRHQLRRIDAEFVDQQRAHLRVAVLLDDEDVSCAAMKSLDRSLEREGAHAQRIDVDAARSSTSQRLVHRRLVEPK